VYVHDRYLVLRLELLVEIVVLIFFQHIDYYKVQNCGQLLNEDVGILLDDFDGCGEIVERTTFFIFIQLLLWWKIFF
jgi:hypothetical protein